MNQITLLGRITHDLQIKYNENNKAYCGFSIAVDRGYQKQGEDKKTDFFNCYTFDKLAENLHKYQGKGNKILIIGEVIKDEYTKDGIKKVNYKVMVQKLTFLDKKRDDQTTKELSNNNILDDADLPF